jgi:hypothetical protein
MGRVEGGLCYIFRWDAAGLCYNFRWDAGGLCHRFQWEAVGFHREVRRSGAARHPDASVSNIFTFSSVPLSKKRLVPIEKLVLSRMTLLTNPVPFLPGGMPGALLQHGVGCGGTFPCRGHIPWHASSISDIPHHVAGLSLHCRLSRHLSTV